MAEILNIDPVKPGGAGLGEVADVLSRSGVIAFPTDTFYGLGVHPFNERAVKKIFSIKNRPPGKPLLVLVTAARQLAEFTGEVPAAAEELIRALWPGPLTLLFKTLPHVPAALTAGTGKIGLRLPGHPFSRDLIAALGHPLTATSANVSGGANMTAAADVARALGGKIDLIVNGGDAPGGQESTVLDVTVFPPRLVRAGAVPRDRIETILNTRLAPC